MIKRLKKILGEKILKWLNEASSPDPDPEIETEEDIDPFWAYMVPISPHPGETIEQTCARAADNPDVVAVRRMRGCKCGMEVVLAVIPANLTDDLARLAVEHPKMLPGDIFVELWDPIAMRHYDHHALQDFWNTHNQKAHQNQARGMLMALPSPGGNGGSDGGSAPSN